MQGSTAGYFGIYDFEGIDLSAGFPATIPATYTNLQGELDITSQIELGGKGMKANGDPQLTNSDSYRVDAETGEIEDSAKATFEVCLSRRRSVPSSRSPPAPPCALSPPNMLLAPPLPFAPRAARPATA